MALSPYSHVVIHFDFNTFSAGSPCYSNLNLCEKKESKYGLLLHRSDSTRAVIGQVHSPNSTS